MLADCHRLGRFDFCHVLLHKNALLPWFILVPHTVVTDLLDLPEDRRHAALREAALVAELIIKFLGCPKINFAAIGNVVPQLHLHVVGRKPDDPCWPAPVWGHLTESREYSANRVEEIGALLVRHCGLIVG